VGEGLGFIGIVARMAVTYTGDTAAPRSMFVKFPSPDPGSRQVGNLYGLYEREVHFYNELAASSGIDVPACYFADYDAHAGQSVVLLEDLTGNGRFGDQVTGCTPAEARLAIASMAKFHAAWWQHPRLTEISWLPTGDALVRNAMVTAYEQCWPLCVERFGHTLTTEIRAAGPTLHRRIVAQLDVFADNPLTIAHGDYRPDNMWFGHEGSARPLVVFDWQSPNRGWSAYDLAYFIAGSFDTESRRKLEDDLIAEYHGLLQAGGVTGYSLGKLRHDYRACLVVMIGIFVINGATLPTTNPRAIDLFEQVFGRFFAAVADQDALSVLPEA
jgi:aminoglycoside/choline kinase family phosphotransferase